MLNTLHGKLSAGLLTLLWLVGFLYIWLSLFTTKTYIREVNQNLNRGLASHLATHLVAKNLLRDDPRVAELTKAEIKENMVLNPDIEIYILDSNGGILSYSAAPGQVQRNRVALDPIRRFLGGVGSLPIPGDDPRHLGQQKIFSAARIPEDATVKDRIQGYVYIILGGEDYDSVAGFVSRSYILRWSTWITVGSLWLASCCGVLLFYFLTRRLRGLTQNVEAFQAGNFVAPGAEEYALTQTKAQASPSATGDEINRLKLVFNHMAQRIEAQVQEIQEADRHRRELVSNVSHDLRTPLAALRGYLETLLMKEGHLNSQEQREYLRIAVKHSERLEKLVAELFELAKLDAHEAPPHLEAFSLAELTQDVVQKFQLAAEHKGVRLEAHFAEDLPFVYADIALIETALGNLLENALRYTPTGGQISVALELEAARIAVRIRDTGQGIEPADLPHIFDRSYRATNQPLDSLPGAGLGLAITKRILELHHSQIAVVSTVERGTTFAFYLPVQQEQL